ncbi:hypothetical protein TIFTF001_006764 [Ficus carica]|uniref:Uncharacterized protein n=1 Tax=Ficus carica TaxID=3494 RepID=A0AA88D162_FICCA|nr:hypothetical protein TIFTF001_006764 [Ficus carica]
MHPQPELERGSYGSSMGIEPRWTKKEAKEGATLLCHPIHPFTSTITNRDERDSQEGNSTIADRLASHHVMIDHIS